MGLCVFVCVLVCCMFVLLFVASWLYVSVFCCCFEPEGLRIAAHWIFFRLSLAGVNILNKS